MTMSSLSPHLVWQWSVNEYTGILLSTKERTQEIFTRIYLQFPEKFWFDTEVTGPLMVYHRHSNIMAPILLCMQITSGGGT